MNDLIETKHLLVNKHTWIANLYTEKQTRTELITNDETQIRSVESEEAIEMHQNRKTPGKDYISKAHDHIRKSGMVGSQGYETRQEKFHNGTEVSCDWYQGNNENYNTGNVVGDA